MASTFKKAVHYADPKDIDYCVEVWHNVLAKHLPPFADLSQTLELEDIVDEIVRNPIYINGHGYATDRRDGVVWSTGQTHDDYAENLGYTVYEYFEELFYLAYAMVRNEEVNAIVEIDSEEIKAYYSRIPDVRWVTEWMLSDDDTVSVLERDADGY